MRKLDKNNFDMDSISPFKSDEKKSQATVRGVRITTKDEFLESYREYTDTGRQA